MIDLPFFVLAIIALGVLIFVHELGHFLFAKANGVGVVEFAVGFGKPLFQKQVGETTYSLRAIPLGGFVKMLGDDPRLLERAQQKTVADEGELEESPQEIETLLAQRERWFLSQSYWPKFLIVFAGPLFNILFAILLSVISYSVFGKPVPVEAPVIGEAMPGDPAHQAGLQSGDLILSIDGEPVATWTEMAKTISTSGGKELSLLVQRITEGGNTERIEIPITAVNTRNEGYEQFEDQSIQRSYRIGVFPQTKRERIPFVEAISHGAYHVWYLSRMTLKGLYGMIRGAISPKNIAGPISIIKFGANAAQTGLDRLFDFTIFLSVSLAILNLLPIPILDGGHLVFFTLEALRGAPLSLRVQEGANQFGLAVLMLLMVFALGNDFVRLFWPIE